MSVGRQRSRPASNAIPLGEVQVTGEGLEAVAGHHLSPLAPSPSKKTSLDGGSRAKATKS